MPAVLFDLDGTLIDSVPDLHVATNRVLSEEERPPVTLAQTRSFVGHGARVLVRRALAVTGDPPDDATVERACRRFLARYMDRVCVDTTTFPGARQTLDTLATRGWALGLTTNKPEAHARAVLDALDLTDAFGVILGGDSVPDKKPDPSMLHAALDALGCAPEGSWLVGDSPVDAEAGRRAGLQVALVDFGYTPVPVAELEPDRVVSALPELLDAL